MTAARLSHDRGADAHLRYEAQRIVGNGPSWARQYAFEVLQAALSVPAPTLPALDAERLREVVWSAQHDATCPDGDPHPYTDHLPWDDAEDEKAARVEADAIIRSVREALRDAV